MEIVIIEICLHIIYIVIVLYRSKLILSRSTIQVTSCPSQTRPKVKSNDQREPRWKIRVLANPSSQKKWSSDWPIHGDSQLTRRNSSRLLFSPTFESTVAVHLTTATSPSTSARKMAPPRYNWARPISWASSRLNSFSPTVTGPMKAHFPSTLSFPPWLILPSSLAALERPLLSLAVLLTAA